MPGLLPPYAAPILGLERLGRFDEAFAEIASRNIRERPSDAEAKIKSLQLQAGEILKIFDGRARAPEIPGHVTRSPIFVVGLPRSGSTLIEQILATHSKVFGLGEPDALHPILQKDVSWLLPGSLDVRARHRLANLYLAAVGRNSFTKRRFVDKTLRNFLYVGLISEIFPRSSIIVANRHAVDLCFSCLRESFEMTEGTWFARDMHDIARYYIEFRNLFDHWRVLLGSRIIEVKYEELVARFENESRRIVEATGLRWEERCLRYYENTRTVLTASKDQVRLPIYTEAVGRWWHYRKHLGPLIEALGPYAPPDALT